MGDRFAKLSGPELAIISPSTVPAQLKSAGMGDGVVSQCRRAPMFKGIHRLYILFLLFLALFAIVAIGVRGADYYLTPMAERPFHPDYEILKPTGTLSHGYGIIGSLMIVGGVILYSSRKRIRAFSGIGKLQYVLEFHIFLCLTGPILVLYHTTFKFGGLVSVSFWSMMSVVASGLVGRYVYVQIPRGIHGNELSVAELNREREKIRELLEMNYRIPAEVVHRIDRLALPAKSPAGMSLFEAMRFLLLDSVYQRRSLRGLLRKLPVPAKLARSLHRVALQRLLLTRRIAFLEQFRRIFHYWHVIHLPFSIVMFVILFVHVGVAIALGYRWIF